MEDTLKGDSRQAISFFFDSDQERQKFQRFKLEVADCLEIFAGCKFIVSNNKIEIFCSSKEKKKQINSNIEKFVDYLLDFDELIIHAKVPNDRPFKIYLNIAYKWKHGLL